MPRDHASDDRLRSAALRRLRLLDPEPEPFFEDLIDFLQQTCHAPIAVVSLTDNDRQLFKARRGIAAQELPRTGSFCAHVVESGRPLVINDAAADPAFRDNTLVTGPTAIRAYAGVPIFAEGELALGTVCALDTSPHAWTEAELNNLRRVARMVATYAEERAAHADLATRVSQAQERERSIRLQRRIIAAMSEGVVVHAGDGSVIESNRAAREILGLTEDQLHGRTPLDPRWQAMDETGALLAGEDHPAAQALATGETQNRIMSVLRPNRDRRYLMVTATPLMGPSDDDGQVVATFVDITDQIAQQQQLSDLLRNAEKASREKSEFLSTLSHEIRTPLNGLLGIAQYLARKISNPALRSSIDLLRTSGLALKEIVDDALEIDRIEAGVFRLREETFDLAAAVGEVASVYMAVAEEKTIGLEVTPELAGPAFVTTDAGRFKQILHNLISNAVKYTARGHVRVRVDLVERSSSAREIRVEVTDTGRGISPDFVDTLFAKFARASDTDQEHGAGLGLYLSLKLARLMGGDLAYRPNAPAGSIFTLCLPAEEADSGADASPAIEGAIDHLRVLAVEDHPVNQEILARLLEPFEMTVTFVANGKEALEKAMSGEFDLVLMDRQLPGLDGIEATRQLRAREQRAGRAPTPVIFVSADGTPGSIARAMDAGAQGYITKPIIVEALAREIARVLSEGAEPPTS